MPRKSNGSTTSTRSKKTAVPAEPTPVQVMAEVQAEAPKETQDVQKESRKNGRPVPVAAPLNLAPINLEEEIRRRAYELYLERRAATGTESGNPNQDWLIAEHEIRSRYNRLARHATA
jgi:hypothetical protein